MFLAAEIAIVTACKSPVIDIALMKRKLTWIMLNEKFVSVLQDKQPLFIKYGPSGLLTYRSVMYRVEFTDDCQRIPRQIHPSAPFFLYYSTFSLVFRLLTILASCLHSFPVSCLT